MVSYQSSVVSNQWSVVRRATRHASRIRRFHIIQIVRADGLIDSLEQNQGKSRDAKADYNRGEDERLGERVGKRLGYARSAGRNERRPAPGQTGDGED